MFKRLAALILAVALLAPALLAAANPPQVFGPDPREVGPTPGSLTITRYIAEPLDPQPGDPADIVGTRIAGVPIRITLVTSPDGEVPTAANAIPVPAPYADVRYGVTNTNGYYTFTDLPIGIWLVEELGSVEIDNVTFVNPITDPEERFNDFVVAVPRWIADPTHPDGGEWDFDVRAYPKSGIGDYDGAYKNEVETIGDVITWQIGHRIPSSVAALPHFGATDILSENLRFIAGSVEGRFTPDGVTDTSWNAGLPLNGPTHATPHFTVLHVGQQIDIQLTEAGRAHLAANGYLVDGFVMFRLSSRILEAGLHSNVATWNVGEPPYCPADDPDCEPIICPPTDPDCDEPCPVDDPTCDNVIVPAFNLEVLKRNVARQGLNGAVFHLYRELTADEVAAGVTGHRTAPGSTPVVRLVDHTGAHITGTTATVDGVMGVTNFGGVPLNGTAPNPQIWLFEYTPPTGYRFINPWMRVNVVAAYADADYVVEVIVYNEPDGGWNLPQTGGVGTVLLTVAGLVLVGGALVLFVGSKKDEEVA